MLTPHAFKHCMHESEPVHGSVMELGMILTVCFPCKIMLWTMPLCQSANDKIHAMVACDKLCGNYKLLLICCL